MQREAPRKIGPGPSTAVIRRPSRLVYGIVGLYMWAGQDAASRLGGIAFCNENAGAMGLLRGRIRARLLLPVCGMWVRGIGPGQGDAHAMLQVRPATLCT